MQRTSVYIITCILASLGFVATLSAEDKFTKVGTTGFVFLEIPVSARSAAMGETGISLTNAGVDGMYLNPALIATQTNRIGLGITQADWYVGTQHQAAGMTLLMGGNGVLGIQIINLDFGTISKTRNPTWQEQGSYIELGTYTAGATALGVSFGRFMTDRFSFGSSLKYVRESIDGYLAENVVVDIGFLYFTGYGDLRIATCLQNFGLETQYVSEKFKMPQKLTLGMATEIFGDMGDSRHLTLLLEAVHPNDIGEHFHLGSELVMGVLSFRGGYKFGYEDEGLSVGLGLKASMNGRQLHTDLAYADHRYLSSSLRYSLSVFF